MLRNTLSPTALLLDSARLRLAARRPVAGLLLDSARLRLAARRPVAMAGLLFVALSCASPPEGVSERESRCRSRSSESGISVDCPQSDDRWSDRAAEEAREAFDERSPVNR